jgi:hypothetical protein
MEKKSLDRDGKKGITLWICVCSICGDLINKARNFDMVVGYSRYVNFGTNHHPYLGDKIESGMNVERQTSSSKS